MEVTNVNVRKFNDAGKMKAIVSVTFDHAFVVHDIKVIEGRKGLFIAMPNHKIAEDDYKDIAHPLNSVMRNKIRDAVITEYQRVLREDKPGIRRH